MTSARPLDGFRVEVCFDDGREGVAEQLEVHVLEAGAYRWAQAARAGDTVRSALLPDLGFDVDELFTPL
ncbi:MAG: hypothetical protein OXC31_24970 [Spirochaetaceae bacterium]|nr:hypothetical protein [Spirochaetaceae bacterium]